MDNYQNRYGSYLLLGLIIAIIAAVVCFVKGLL